MGMIVNYTSIAEQLFDIIISCEGLGEEGRQAALRSIIVELQDAYERGKIDGSWMGEYSYEDS